MSPALERLELVSWTPRRDAYWSLGSPSNGCLCTHVWCMGVVLVYSLLQWGTFAFHAMFWPGMMSLLTIIVGKW